VEWVLLVSLEWVVLGSPGVPTTTLVAPFASEELCKKAVEAIKTEMDTPIPGQRAQVFSHVVCFARKDKQDTSRP
jgi:hypothetical protein